MDEIRFIRYGTPPPSGISWNYAENRAEGGLSVYQLSSDGVAIGTIRAEFADRKKVYIGRGIVIGRGSDGEPIVKVKFLRVATSRQEERAYYGMSREKYLALIQHSSH